jgi:rod shape-determining protein MreD
MSLTLAAVGAVVMALLQSTIVPYVELAGAKPDLLLVYAVVVTIVVGMDHGLTAAFVGGITIDALAARPLGSSAFVLLLAVGAALLIGRGLVRTRALSAIVAVVACSVLAPIVSLVLYGALRNPIPVADPLAAIVPDLVYSTAIGAVGAVAATRLHRRYFERERIDW